MSHHLKDNGYRLLAERLNLFPQGAPVSELLYRILALIFNEKDAERVSRLPLRPFSARKAAGIWRVPEAEAAKILQDLASRALLLDLERNGTLLYVLPPPMAGFFEFSLMRMRTDLDQRELSRLFYQYLNMEDAFIRELFTGGRTQLGRVLVNEPALALSGGSQVLDYERASEIIRSATHIAVGLCYCRHKMFHLGRACQAPLDNCLTLNDAAASLIRNKVARSVEPVEALEILDRARSGNLVQCADNVQQGVNFICNCCGCCCEAMIAVRRLAIPQALYTTNCLPEVNRRICTGCGSCVRSCPIDAIDLPAPPSGNARELVQPTLKADLCLGCGVCANACPQHALVLRPRKQRIVTPVNTAHRVVLMAVERGKLQNLIFDNHALLSHRLMAAVLGAILRLPPLKRLMAKSQLNSRYLETIFREVDVGMFSK
ncbi:4Fe-4S dicluster domain-containing protein [Geomesophilobacter sediminis]|uniref:4Fe-4S dicluster domain-containing protein n=1 Tax=Geomesophilobacter sediminis TaxID=2798584 RepID=A0A8J7J8R8_9BACT|nr:4Fe-4S dicluster domain-containing protein [Geomesophilobacter sediminis]MBJ6726086.1 4Fe-4S dicluster domain-containing protein [Geomesophilobacter sediminis]